MLDTYAKMCEEFLAIPVIKGQKTEKEKFSGAHSTYTIESLMHDGKALQSGTSHNFGTGFAKAFDIKFADKDSEMKYAHQTSWGVTTRLIGAIIMVHGDSSGLVLPPKVAPTQVVIIPIAAHKEGVIEKANELQARLATVARVKCDTSDKTPGWKFSEYEMKGIPVRVEIGPKDIENHQAVLVRRDTREKIVVSLDELEIKVAELLEDIQRHLYAKALAKREAMTYTAKTMDELKENAQNRPGFTKAMWCMNQACEDKIKEEVGFTLRCMPFVQEEISQTCVCCGKKAKTMVYWAKAY